MYGRDGVVLLRGALDADAIAECRAAWEWSMRNPGRGASVIVGIDDQKGRGGRIVARSKVADGEAGRYYQEAGNPRAAEAYRRVISHPAVVRAVRRAFGRSDADLWFLGEQVFLKEGGAARTVWHQDSSDIPIAGPDVATVWMAFEDTSKALRPGVPQALEFVRGSHREFADPAARPYDSAYGLHRGRAVPDVEAARSDADRARGVGGGVVSFDTRPGDVLIFHPATLHGGGPCPPGTRRRSLALRYFGPRAYVSLRSWSRASHPSRPSAARDAAKGNRIVRAMRAGEGALFRDDGFDKVA